MRAPIQIYSRIPNNSDHVGAQCIAPNTHQPKMPHCVTLSAAKGLSHWAARCFAALSMTAWSQHDSLVAA